MTETQMAAVMLSSVRNNLVLLAQCRSEALQTNMPALLKTAEMMGLIIQRVVQNGNAAKELESR